MQIYVLRVVAACQTNIKAKPSNRSVLWNSVHGRIRKVYSDVAISNIDKYKSETMFSVYFERLLCGLD